MVQGAWQRPSDAHERRAAGLCRCAEGEIGARGAANGNQAMCIAVFVENEAIGNQYHPGCKE
jgi:hypothetical protein